MKKTYFDGMSHFCTSKLFDRTRSVVACSGSTRQSVSKFSALYQASANHFELLC